MNLQQNVQKKALLLETEHNKKENVGEILVRELSAECQNIYSSLALGARATVPLS
jgi:hypothetical protein